MGKTNARSSETQLEGTAGKSAYGADYQAASHRVKYQGSSFKVFPMKALSPKVENHC